MAIIPGKQKTKLAFVDAKMRKQKKLLYLAAVIILATVGVYFIYAKKISLLPSSNVSPTLDTSSDLSSRIIELLKPVSLDLSLFKNKKFQSLILPGDFPIVPGEKGRADPFAPF